MQTLPPVIHDEFAMGEVTRSRRWVAHQSARLFAPPYLPGPLIGYILLLFLLDTLYGLSQQKSEFWTTLTSSQQGALFLTRIIPEQLQWIAGNMVFALLLAGLLAVLTRRVAFPIWLLANLIFSHLVVFTTKQGFQPFLPLEYHIPGGWLLASFTLLFSLIWSLGFTGAVQWLSPGQSVELLSRPPALFKISSAALVVLCVVCAAAWLSVLAQPRPQWRKIEKAQPAPARYSFSLAYDTHRQRAVMFGGGNHWRPEDEQWYGENDTWEWDGSTWAQVSSPVSPPPRLFAGMAYDEKRALTVLYGGSHLGIDYQDTWEWDGQSWKQRTPTHNPGPRERFQMVYDPKREQVIFYGGITSRRTNNESADTWHSDAWAWDGTDWVKIPMAWGPKLCCYAVAYDPLLEAPLLLHSAGLHIWSGDRFVAPRPYNSPLAEGQGALAYDPKHQVVISFGGEKSGAKNARQQPGSYTWQFDGVSWQKIHTSDSPSSRMGHALFYDTFRQRILLVGGIGNDIFFNDTWELVLP